jgi:hypothetical protein
MLSSKHSIIELGKVEEKPCSFVFVYCIFVFDILKLWVVKFLIIISKNRFDIPPNISHDTKKWVVKFRGVKFPGSKIPKTVNSVNLNAIPVIS